MDYRVDLVALGCLSYDLRQCGQMRFPSFYTWIGPLKVILGHVFQYECEMRWELFAHRLFLSD